MQTHKHFTKCGHFQVINGRFLSQNMLINLVTWSCISDKMSYVAFENKDKKHYDCNL